MMGLFLSACDEEKKEVVIEFVSIASVSLTKSDILMDKVQEILLKNNINISTTCFSCLGGTNAISGEHTGLQKRIHNLAPFSICQLQILSTDFVSSFYLVSFLGLNQSIQFC